MKLDRSLCLAVAHEFGSPTYLYFAEQIIQNFKAYEAGFKNYPHQICYAVKANSNLSILKLLAEQGSGFDIVSVGYNLFGAPFSYWFMFGTFGRYHSIY